MPPIVIDLRTADDRRDVVHRAVQALAEGKLVAFPTETVYGVAASALCDAAVRRLLQGRQFPATRPITLAIKSADEALDYVPDLGRIGQRLARRCWPGPVTLVVKDHHPDSVIRQLAPSLQEAIAPQGLIGLRVPAHDALQDVLRLLAGPVVLASADRAGAQEALTAQDVLQSQQEAVQLVLDDGRSRLSQPASVVRVGDKGYDVLEVGVVSEQTLRRLASTMVLFVCTGNTCRSPMAEVMFRQAVAKRLGCSIQQVEDRGVMVQSAGISAMMGSRASLESVQVMGQMGLDLSAHESQPLTDTLVRHSDLILAMTRSHRQAILDQWPSAASRVQLVCRDGSDVADPVGAPAEHYRRCAAQIQAQLEHWANELPL